METTKPKLSLGKHIIVFHCMDYNDDHDDDDDDRDDHEIFSFLVYGIHRQMRSRGIIGEEFSFIVA